jgi:hypothetical protein
MNRFQEYTEQELREHINSLLDNDCVETAEEALTSLAYELGIQLKPRKLEIVGYIYSYGSHSITMDGPGGWNYELPGLISDAFGGTGWAGTEVKLTVEEVVREDG